MELGHTPELNPKKSAHIDQMKKDMLSGDFDWHAKENIISATIQDDVIHIAEGQNRINAAIEIFEATGDDHFFHKLLNTAQDYGRSCFISDPPEGPVMPVPRRPIEN